MTLEEISADFRELGLPRFRAGQVFRWLSRGAEGFSQMSDLSKELREQLSEHYAVRGVEIVRKQVSQIDGTIKYLFRLFDGEHVEAVLMRYHYGISICISKIGRAHV